MLDEFKIPEGNLENISGGGYIFAGNCIGCGACESVCPMGAIILCGGGVIIGPDCVECGMCANVCVTGAIVSDF